MSSGAKVDWKSPESSVRLLSAVLAAHPELKLNMKEISKCFGGASTPSAMENRFRNIKKASVEFRKAVDAGRDPFNISVDGASVSGSNKPSFFLFSHPIHIAPAPSTQHTSSNAKGRDLISLIDVARHMDPPCTIFALQHRMRVVNQEVKELRESMKAGVTESSLEHRCRPLKAEAKKMREGVSAGGGAVATPKKRATPGKKGSAKSKKDAEDSDDDEELKMFAGGADFDGTPTKTPKGSINKVKSGRVSKKSSPVKKNGFQKAANDEEEEDAFGMDTKPVVKAEGGPGAFDLDEQFEDARQVIRDDDDVGYSFA